MAYTIIKSDGTILTTIDDGTINTTSTSLGLMGRNFAGYGQAVDTNFVHQLENFAAATPPPYPIRGQLWFNTNNNTLYICPTDGETSIANWLALATTSSTGTTTFGSVTVQGNLQANVITAITSVIASDGVFTDLIVNDLATISNANVTTASIGAITTTTITTGSIITPGTVTGTWTFSGTAGGNAVVVNSGNIYAAVGLKVDPSNFYDLTGNIISVGYGNANVSQFLPAYVGQVGNGATTFRGTTLTTGSNITDGTITGNWSLSAGSSLVASRAATVTVNAQPNITSTGTLTSLTVSGNANVGGSIAVTANIGGGNLNTTGNANVGNIQTKSITYSDSITLTTPTAGSIIKIWEQSGAGNAVIEFGRYDGVISEPKFDFHSGNIVTDYDSRITASGGNGTQGSGNLSLIAANLNLQGQVNAVGNLTVSGSYLSTQPTFRNLIINGDFSIWQRATSQTSSGYGSDDRWVNLNVGSTKTHSRQGFTPGQTEVPGEPVYFSRTVVSSAIGAGNLVVKQQRFEGVRSFAGRNVRVSFWAKSNSPRRIAIDFLQRFGSGGSPSADVSGIGAQQFLTNVSWKKYAVTVAMPSIAGKTIGSDNNDLVELTFWFDAGSNYDSRTASLGQQSGTFDIAQVQIEEGTVETPFENRPVGIELALCQRYYEEIPIVVITTIGIYMPAFYKVTKRRTPNLTVKSGSLSGATLNPGFIPITSFRQETPSSLNTDALIAVDAEL
jgi:hypothetical protein